MLLVGAVKAILVLLDCIDIEVSHVMRFPLALFFLGLHLVDQSANCYRGSFEYLARTCYLLRIVLNVLTLEGTDAS